MRAVATALALAALIAAAPPASAAPGSLDPTFGVGGTTVGPSGSATAVAAGPSGRILVGGETYDGRGGHPLTVAAFSPGGALDTGFGHLGLATAPVMGLAGVAEAPDGSVVATGYRTRAGRREPVLVRFSASGALVGVSGASAGDGDALPRWLALEPDGSALVACDAVRAGVPVIAILRFGPGGAPSPAGPAYVEMPGRALTSAGLALGPGPLVTVAGTAYDPLTGNTDPLVTRLLAGGRADPSFGGGSPVLVPTGLASVRAAGVALGADGSATVAASGRTPFGPELFALRLTTTGRLDTRFGDAGVTTVPVGGSDGFATAVAVDAAGDATLLGQAADAAGARQVLTRLRPDGALDPAFAPLDGALVPAARPPFRPAALAVDSGGRLVVAGSGFGAGAPAMTLARYLGDG